MEKYKALIESTIPEDVALGLFLAHRDKLLTRTMSVLDGIPTKCNETFTVQFNNASVWVWENKICIVIGSLSEPSRYTSCAGYYPEFDFRTKEEI